MNAADFSLGTVFRAKWCLNTFSEAAVDGPQRLSYQELDQRVDHLPISYRAIPWANYSRSGGLILRSMSRHFCKESSHSASDPIADIA